MPHHKFRDGSLDLVFGYGDLIVSTVLTETKRPLGIAIEHSPTILPVGKEFDGNENDLELLLCMQFENIESLDTVIGRLNALRDAMIEHQNKT